MKVFKYGKDDVSCIEEGVIALGLFDGVHVGHRSLLAAAKKRACELGVSASVFSFYSEDSMPKSKARIYSTEDKLEIFERLGIENVILAEFSKIADVSAEEFVKDILIDKLHMRAAVTGRDFRFGKGALGDVTLLYSLLEEQNKELLIEDEWRIGEEKISSTLIKNLLTEGKTEEANKLLASPYFIKSKVVRGDGRGRTLGFPTVNTEINKDRDILKHGVYRTATMVSGKLYQSITNVGECPTFEARALHAETYLIDYFGNLYGEDVKIFFLGYLREERRFDSQEELIMQINVDKNTAIERNGKLLWQEIGQN